LSLNLITEPEKLVLLEAEMRETPIAATMQKVHTVTNTLPRYISLLLRNHEESLIQMILAMNGMQQFEKIFALMMGKKVLVVTAMSSGAMIMPFFIEALRRKGVQAELEVCCPELEPPKVKDKFRLSRNIFVPLRITKSPELILVLDDVINYGATISLMVEAMQKKYGANTPMIMGTPILE
jgi:hypoxanthine-guanine phosphoribosyltransferase